MGKSKTGIQEHKCFCLSVLLAFSVSLLLTSCNDASQGKREPQTDVADENNDNAIPASNDSTRRQSSIQLFFNDPLAGIPRLDQPERQANGLHDQLVSFIDSAEESLDIALFELGLPAVEQAILNAYQRGVEVRLVADATTASRRDNFDTLKSAGIPIQFVSGQCKGFPRLMHHKFLIRDNEAVWTGSYNPTQRATFSYFEVGLQLPYSAMAEVYAKEFEQLFAGRSGQDKTDNNREQIRVEDGPHMEAYFSPSDSTERRLVQAIDQASQEIHIAMFFLTNDEIARALLRAHDQGVDIHAVWDYRGFEHRASWMDELLERGVGVLDALPGLVHAKLAVIDDESVILGSTNWTLMGVGCNDENLVIFRNDVVAQTLAAQVERLVEDAKEYDQDPTLAPRVTVRHHNHRVDVARVEWRPRFEVNRRSAAVEQYRVYRSDQPEGEFELVAEKPGGSYRYLDSEVKVGEEYYYYVTGVIDGKESERGYQYSIRIREGREINCDKNSKEEDCPDDGLDNDGDGYTDCEDWDTIDYPLCATAGDPAVQMISINWDARGDDRENPNGEVLILEALQDRDLSGWDILDKSNNRFTFPDGYTVTAGTRVEIRSGCGQSRPNEDKFYWHEPQSECSAIWNNDDGDAAYLRNPEGQVVDRCFYETDIDLSPIRCNTSSLR